MNRPFPHRAAIRLAAALVLAALLGRPTVAAEPAKITIAQTSIALGFTVVAIAADEGFYKKEGLDADIQIVSSGDPQVLAALHSGGAQFGAMTLVPALQAMARGEKLRLVAPFVREYVIQFVINPAAAAKAGITDTMPLKEKYEHAKGLTVGTLDVGGGLHLMFKGMAQQYGLNADRDYTVTAINSYPTLLAACKRGQIDMALTAIPYGTLGVETQGLTMFADFWNGAVPEFDGALHQGMVVEADYAEQHPDIVAHMNRALDGALRFMHTNPGRTIADLHKRYPKLPEDLLHTFIVTDAKSFAADAIAPHHGFDIIRSFVAAHFIASAADIKYGDFVLPAAQEK
jgi:NitT/TauT family transport system substrate-binding protein